MIGSDFVEHVSTRQRYCSECGVRIPAGIPAMVSIKNNRVRKVLCLSEDCRVNFDDHFWQEVARQRREL